MFAMLNGRWPRPAAPAGSLEGVEALVAGAVRAQVEAGLELVTDGLVRWPEPAAALRGALAGGDTGPDGMLVRAWRAAASVPEAAGATVAAVMTGPYSLALASAGGEGPSDAEAEARRLAGELVALEAAGCPLVVVEEPAAVRIGADEHERRRFREAQRQLLAGVPGLHVMLAITGGSAWEAGAETILEAPYRSYLLDLVAGPDNWYLARAVPGDRGIVCAALRRPSREDQAPLLVWAARYAASSNGRGMERVGLANASSLAGLAPEAAQAALAGLARAARLGAMEPDDAVAAGLDQRTFRQPAGRGARRGGLPRT